MDNAWKILKRIVLVLFLIYVISFLIYTDFLLNMVKIKTRRDFSQYLYEILNLK